MPRLFVDIVKLPLKPPPLCVAWLDEAEDKPQELDLFAGAEVQTMLVLGVVAVVSQTCISL